MRGNYSSAPTEMPVPQTAQVVCTIAAGIVIAVSLFFAIRDWRKTRSLFYLALLAGAAICTTMEPIWDVLGHLWYANRGGQWVGIPGEGRSVPLWPYGAYVGYFGSLAFVAFRNLQKGVTKKTIWAGIAVGLVADFAFEVPILATDFYVYYGEQGPTIGGLPIYWAFLNSAGALLLAFLLLRFHSFFAGRRALLLLLLPAMAQGVTNITAGWPMFFVLTTGPSPAVAWGASIASCILSLALIQKLASALTAPLPISDVAAFAHRTRC